MKSFKQYLKEDDIDRIIIELPDNLMISIEESRWVSSGKQGWEVRVDPENPALKVKRHATVARSKHKRSKNMQASAFSI